jgi:hypothetical protein
MVNRKLSIKEALFIGFIFLLLFGGHYASIVPGRRWILALTLLFGYNFIVYIIFLLILPKLDSFIKAIVGSIFIPMLAIYVVLAVGSSLDSNPLSVLTGTFLEINRVIVNIFTIYVERFGWFGSIAILAIWFFRERSLRA